MVRVAFLVAVAVAVVVAPARAVPVSPPTHAQAVQAARGLPQPTARVGGFLANWMNDTLSVLGGRTLLQLSLPGTHDSMTYDLSEQVADGGIDDHSEIAQVLNEFTSYVPIPWLRTQAQTQGLNVTEQLNQGVRFVDFRVMYSSGDWYCLHFLQSNHKAIDYLKQVRGWVDDHPSEVVVLWLSKHGSVCANGTDQYPNVSVAIKQQFWSQVEAVFDGVLFNSAESFLNTTSLSELLLRNQRVVVFASDHRELTNSSLFALDGCLLDNELQGGVDTENSTVSNQVRFFESAESRIAANSEQGRFLLASLASGQPDSSIQLAAELYFTDVDVVSNRRACAALYHIPRLDDWCPTTSLLDVSQLENYYNQLSVETAFQRNLTFPNAFYINAYDADGTLRVGTKSLALSPSAPACDVFHWTSCSTHQPSCPDGYRGNGDTEHWDAYDSDGTEHTFCGWAWQNHYKCCRNEVDGHDTARYALVDTVIATNVRQACAQTAHADCDRLQAVIAQRRAAHPLTVWDDKDTGRLADWPSVDPSSLR